MGGHDRRRGQELRHGRQGPPGIGPVDPDDQAGGAQQGEPGAGLVLVHGPQPHGVAARHRSSGLARQGWPPGLQLPQALGVDHERVRAHIGLTRARVDLDPGAVDRAEPLRAEAGFETDAESDGHEDSLAAADEPGRVQLAELGALPLVAAAGRQMGQEHLDEA